MGKRLDVLHERRATVDAALERAAAGRRRPAVVQPAHERRLLAAHESIGHADDLHGMSIWPLQRGGFERRNHGVRLTRDGDIALARAGDRGGSLHPVQHEVRIADHQDLVLGARGLAFDSVGDNDGSTAAGDAA